MATQAELETIKQDARAVAYAAGAVHAASMLLASARTQAVAVFAEACGNQSQAGRELGVDQADVNRMVRKVKEREDVSLSGVDLGGMAERLSAAVSAAAPALARLQQRLPA